MAIRVLRRKRRQTQLVGAAVPLPLEWNLSSAASAPGETTMEIQVPYADVAYVEQSPVDVWLQAFVGGVLSFISADSAVAVRNAFGLNLTFSFSEEIDLAAGYWLMIPEAWPGIVGSAGQFCGPVRLWSSGPPLTNRRFVGWSVPMTP